MSIAVLPCCGSEEKGILEEWCDGTIRKMECYRLASYELQVPG
jgi:hypothetical protein